MNCLTSGVAKLVILTTFTATLPGIAYAELLPGEARTLLAFPEGDSPEGIAVDAADGAVYVGNRSPFANSISSDIIKINDDGKVDFQFASLPPAPAASNGLLAWPLIREMSSRRSTPISRKLKVCTRSAGMELASNDWPARPTCKSPMRSPSIPRTTSM